MDLGTVTPATFEPHVGTAFLVLDASDDVRELQLSEIRRHAPQPRGPRLEPFSAEFHGPGSPVLEQRIYRLRHDVLGELTIFLVPLGPSRAGAMRYEAVFS